MYLCGRLLPNWLCCEHQRLVNQLRHLSSSGELEEAIKNVLSGENKARTIARADEYNKQNVVPQNIPKTAAVLVALCHINNEPSMLLTVRSTKMKKHRGEVSFPGGGMDYGDPSMVYTALRETEEEIGFSKSQVDVWTTIHPVPDRTYTRLVYPVIGDLGHIDLSQLRINSNEVQEILPVPLRFLLDPANCGITRFRFKNDRVTKFNYMMPVYHTNPRIWGLTAVFINMALILIIPKHHRLLVQGRFHVKKAGGN